MAPLVVLLVLLVALSARLLQLDSAAGLANANHDEGVYASAAQLLLHGVLPYRDYSFAHPPAAAFIFSPAMLLDSSAWGDAGSFLAARQLSVAYSLVSVALVFAIGHRLAGWWGATAAALVWSLDGRVVGLSDQVMLDVPMAMFSFGAILAYLTVHPALVPRVTRRQQMIGLAVAGGLAALSVLTKVVGVTVLFAIVADLVWRHLSTRTEPQPSSAPLLASLLLGAGVVSAVVLAPFMIAAPGELLPQAVFFQLLRPYTEVGPMDRIGRLAEHPDQVPILVMAGLGLALATISVAVRLASALRHRGPDCPRLSGPWLAGWRVVVLWVAFNALTYLSTRTFQPQYQLHLLAGMALLVAGVGLLPQWIKSALPGSALVRRWELPALTLVIIAVAALQVPPWNRSTGDHVPEHVAMSLYLRGAVPSGAKVLTLDARVMFLAGRKPSSSATGYLVDPYGHLVLLGLELADRSTAELLEAVVRGEEHDWSNVVRSRIAQADVLARLRDADLVIVHQNERWRLGPAADALDALADHVERFEGYLLYFMVQPAE